MIVRDDPSTERPKQGKASAAFESGFAAASSASAPLVGVELSSTEPSQIPWYQGKDISSVDDLDATAGQAALIYALTGITRRVRHQVHSGLTAAERRRRSPAP